MSAGAGRQNGLPPTREASEDMWGRRIGHHRKDKALTRDSFSKTD